jgi:hypothetical protein
LVFAAGTDVRSRGPGSDADPADTSTPPASAPTAAVAAMIRILLPVT